MVLKNFWRECECSDCSRMQVLDKYNGGNFFNEEDTLVVQALCQEGLMKKPQSWSAKTTIKGKGYLLFQQIVSEIMDRRVIIYS